MGREVSVRRKPVKILTMIPSFSGLGTLALGLVVRHLKRLVANEIEIEVLVLGRSDEDAKAAEAAGADLYNGTKPNQAFGAMMNQGLAIARDRGADAVMTLPPSVLVDPEYFALIEDAFGRGAEFAGYLDFFPLDLECFRLGYWRGYAKETGHGWRKGHAIKLARVYSRSLLERAEWKLFPDQDEGLDWLVHERMRTEFAPITTASAICADHGALVNLYSTTEVLEKLEAEIVETDIAKFISERFGEETAAELLALAGQDADLIFDEADDGQTQSEPEADTE